MPTEGPRSLLKCSATHHISANHQIEVTRDTARPLLYVLAVRVKSNPSDLWTGDGWNDCEFIRTPVGWRVSSVRRTAVRILGTIESVLSDYISHTRG
ncbi:MAG: nuclear transport factor 2 family protein [Ahniella sp.]|nr:nuclear transport factor 2 family protein [Ahniella sp.]